MIKHLTIGKSPNKIRIECLTNESLNKLKLTKCLISGNLNMLKLTKYLIYESLKKLKLIGYIVDNKISKAMPLDKGSLRGKDSW